jgi:hypothetical protein
MPRRRTTNAEIDAMRMMSEQPLQSHNIYDASGPWGSHRMKYDPTSLARDYAHFNAMRMMRMMSEVPEHNIYDASGPWGKHSMHNDPNAWDSSFVDRFPGVKSGADISVSEGGKKRKNTIKQRKSRKVGKSRKGRSKH